MPLEGWMMSSAPQHNRTVTRAHRQQPFAQQHERFFGEACSLARLLPQTLYVRKGHCLLSWRAREWA